MSKGFRNTVLPASFLLFIFISGPLIAQQVRISSSIDSINYLIGDWIAVHISIQHPFNAVVLWQEVADPDSTSVFEKISESKIDTIRQQGFLSENRIVIFTTFDTGVLRIPSFTYYYSQNEEVQNASTAPIIVYVSDVAVDTAKSFRPVKPPIAVVTAQITWWWYGVIIFSILLIGGWNWYYIRKKRRKLAGALKQITDTRLPHEKATEELEQLEKEQLWQKQEMKRYYVQLTQILRSYMEEGLNIPALEITSRELIAALGKKLNDEELLAQLKNDLLLADFVKFAKANPTAEENDLIMKTAKEFVEKTKPAVVMTQQKEDQPV